jgi:hypothetical protein
MQSDVTTLRFEDYLSLTYSVMINLKRFSNNKNHQVFK